MTVLRPFALWALVATAAGCSSNKNSASSVSSASAALERAAVGQPAPDFELTALDGTTHRLSQYKGKLVVLEWFNPDCPFVRQAHTLGNLKDTKPYRNDDVVWLAINSGAPGKQGHGKAANEAGKAKFAIDYPILLDEAGTVGRAYGAERTPHVYVIDKAGKLVYAGALDNTRDGDPENAEPSMQNYVALALTAARAGQTPDPSSTEAWGCTVKYD